MNDFSFDISHDLLDNLANLSFHNDDISSEINTLLEKTGKHLEDEKVRGNSSCSPVLIRYYTLILNGFFNSLIVFSIRTDSFTGRPEEFYKTVKKKNPRGTTIVVGDYV